MAKKILVDAVVLTGALMLDGGKTALPGDLVRVDKDELAHLFERGMLAERPPEKSAAPGPQVTVLPDGDPSPSISQLERPRGRSAARRPVADDAAAAVTAVDEPPVQAVDDGSGLFSQDDPS